MNSGINLTGIGVDAEPASLTNTPSQNIIETDMPSIGDILEATSPGVELPTVANEYLTQVAEGLATALTNKIGKKIEVKVSNVTCNFIAIRRLEVVGVGSYLFGFSETQNMVPDKPMLAAAEYLEKAAMELASDNVVVISQCVIDPRSYALAGKMISALCSVYLPRINPTKYLPTLKSFLKKDRFGNNTSFRISTRLSDVRMEVERMYPLAILPPVDAGLVVRTVPTDPSDSPKTLLVVGGYVDFTSEGRVKEEVFTRMYPPIGQFVITTILSPTPSIGMVAFGEALIMSGMIFRQGWRDSFRNFSPQDSQVKLDEDSNVIPNLGNLLLDASGKPVTITDNVKLEEFILAHLSMLDHMGQPTGRDRMLLAMDISLGAFRIPGIERFSQGNVAQEVARFLGCDPRVFADAEGRYIPSTIEQSRHVQYIGCTGAGIDTRRYNYLTMTAKDLSNAMMHRLMAMRNSDRSYGLEMLRKLHGEIGLHSLYIRVRVHLGMEFLNRAIREINPKINISWEQDSRVINNTGAIPLDAAIAPMNPNDFGSQFAGNMNNMYGMAYNQMVL